MDRAVMISIRPRWCALIANGRKTIEVRKTRPKLDTPFKCYIYCTHGGRPLVYGAVPCAGGWRETYTQTYGWSREEAERIWGALNGKIIGEFTCNEIDRYAHFGTVGFLPRYMKDNNGYPATEMQLYHLGMRDLDLEDYGGGKPLYGWHISNLVIYDEPKELREFYSMKKCDACKRGDIPSACIYDDDCIVPAVITRPPQSWCYVEELGVDNGT